MGIWQRLGQFLRRRGGLLLAGVWRRMMFRTTFIAVTGSIGKSTCKELIGSVLESQFPTVRTKGGANHYKGIVMTVLRVRPWHKFAVLEVGIDRPGQMQEFARALRPDIAVWVNVARTHSMNFRTLETTAWEKSRLVEGVRAGGLAILNDDNPYIAAYQPPAGIETVYCGTTPRSTIRPVSIQGAWPERFQLKASVDSEPVEVRTNLVGTHWTPSLLPALSLASRAGIPLEQAALAMKNCHPLRKRLTPVELPSGGTLLRDENGSIDTLPAALRVMEQAKAKRRIIVFTDVSDSKQKPRIRLRDIGRQIALSADAAVFVGDHAEHGAKAAIAAGMRPDQVWGFLGIRDAAEHLRNEIKEGDLVLTRGRRVDHLGRICLSLSQDVTCWKEACSKHIACEDCPELSRRR